MQTDAIFYFKDEIFNVGHLNENKQNLNSFLMFRVKVNLEESKVYPTNTLYVFKECFTFGFFSI